MRYWRALLCCVALYGEVLDRVAVSVGTQAITETQLLEEIRLNAFLNKGAPDFGMESKHAAASRLIEQRLVENEMRLDNYPGASPEDALEILSNLEKTRAGSAAAFGRELQSAGVTMDELKEHLLWGLTLAHFIDLRFRPAVQVTRRDVQLYYQEKVIPNYAPGKEPALSEVRAQIEQTLAAERSDKQMDEWLKDAKARANIVFHKEVFEESSGK